MIEQRPAAEDEAGEARGPFQGEASASDRGVALALQAEGTNARFDALMTAVGECIDVTGLDGLTIDEVAERSGLSRATIYRRFGSREGVLQAYLARETLPAIEIGRKIASGSGDLASRLEMVLTHMVDGVRRTPWISREYARGLSPSALMLLQSAAVLVSDHVTVPMLQQARAEGRWDCPAPFDELTSWLIAEQFLLMRMPAADTAEVRRLVSTYIMPVLNLAPIDSPTEDLAAKIEALRRDLNAFSRRLTERQQGKSAADI